MNGIKKMTKKISFIIASVERDVELEKCIGSIEKAHEYRKDVPIEILVIIQNAKKKKDILISYPEMTTFFYVDKTGLSAARNFAIKKSAGDYLVFLDDDAGIDRAFIDVLSKQVTEHDKINAFCGRIIDPVRNAPFSKLFFNRKIKKLHRLEYQYFMGSAHILNRKVIGKVGFYDEHFGVGSKYYRGGEETDIFFRLKSAKETVIYLPDLIFFHPIIYPSFRYVQNYGHAFGALLAKSCVCDKIHSPAYVFILLKMAAKLSIRLLQKTLLKGKYIDRDERYHYGAWLSGIYAGITDFISCQAEMRTEKIIKFDSGVKTENSHKYEKKH